MDELIFPSLLVISSQSRRWHCQDDKYWKWFRKCLPKPAYISLSRQKIKGDINVSLKLTDRNESAISENVPKNQGRYIYFTETYRQKWIRNFRKSSPRTLYIERERERKRERDKQNIRGWWIWVLWSISNHKNSKNIFWSMTDV